jgi:hypothetical protein
MKTCCNDHCIDALLLEPEQNGFKILARNLGQANGAERQTPTGPRFWNPVGFDFYRRAAAGTGQRIDCLFKPGTGKKFSWNAERKGKEPFGRLGAAVVARRIHTLGLFRGSRHRVKADRAQLTQMQGFVITLPHRLRLRIFCCFSNKKAYQWKRGADRSAKCLLRIMLLSKNDSLKTGGTCG